MQIISFGKYWRTSNQLISMKNFPLEKNPPLVPGDLRFGRKFPAEIIREMSGMKKFPPLYGADRQQGGNFFMEISWCLINRALATKNQWFCIKFIYFVLRHQASSYNFLSVIFGILGIFWIGICGRKMFRRKIFGRTIFRSKNHFSKPCIFN